MMSKEWKWVRGFRTVHPVAAAFTALRAIRRIWRSGAIGHQAQVTHPAGAAVARQLTQGK
jgi:hypothetical protein